MVTKQTIARGGTKAVKVILNLMKYIIPAVFILKVLEYSGWLIKISDFFAPYMAYMGLPGEGALVIMNVCIYRNVSCGYRRDHSLYGNWCQWSYNIAKPGADGTIVYFYVHLGNDKGVELQERCPCIYRGLKKHKYNFVLILGRHFEMLSF
ncbi:MAG: nucleoside recognition domain-containing protein [Caulobacteraceae bacterium]